MWKAIPGWEGFYEVSDKGEIRSVDRTITFSDGRVRSYKSKIRAQCKDQAGYMKVTLKGAGAEFRVHVHVLVTAAFIGPRPYKWVVCHGDGDNTNNKLENLRYGTPKDNAADSLRHGTRARGETCGASKITEEKVREIRATRGTMDELADHFGMSRTAIWNIQNRKRWGWLP
jgi:hypothetical protein